MFDSAVKSLVTVCERCGAVGSAFKEYLDKTWGAFGMDSASFPPQFWAHFARPERFRRQFRTTNFIERTNRQLKENLNSKKGLLGTAQFINDQIALSMETLRRIDSGMFTRGSRVLSCYVVVLTSAQGIFHHQVGRVVSRSPRQRHNGRKNQSTKGSALNLCVC